MVVPSQRCDQGGSADSFECVICKLGIADSEITIATKPGRVPTS
jgi:hypothetical protein